MFTDPPFLQEDIDLIGEAFQAAGIDTEYGSIWSDLRDRDRSPYMALVFTRLPNLTKMHARLPTYDTFLSKVVDLALMEPRGSPFQAFQNLKELSVSSDLEEPPSGKPDDLHWLELEHWAPLFSLPHLETLSMLDTNVENTLSYCGTRPRTSSVKHLTIINAQHTTASSPSTQTILSMPHALVSLSFYQNFCGPSRFPLRHFNLRPISNAQLFEALESHRGSLESLDVYRDDVAGMGPPAYNKRISHFGPLRGFERLKNLSIQPEALIGGVGIGEPRAPFRLRDTLPSSIESLTLYGGPGLVVDLELGEQFQEVLGSGAFPNLKSIVFEDAEEIVPLFDPKCVARPNEAVRDACKQAGVTFLEQEGCRLSKGGMQSPWACRMRRQRGKWRKRNLAKDETFSEEDSYSEFEE
jgi:hypothetical protein